MGDDRRRIPPMADAEDKLPMPYPQGYYGTYWRGPMADAEQRPSMRIMRVLVCGGRTYTDLGAVWSQLDAFHALQGPIDVVIHGGARGADLLAEKWAIANGVRHIAFKPDWEAYGLAAGPIRNAAMLAEGKPNLVIGFPGGKGTRDMVKQARETGVDVVLPYGLRND